MTCDYCSNMPPLDLAALKGKKVKKFALTNHDQHAIHRVLTTYSMFSENDTERLALERAMIQQSQDSVAAGVPTIPLEEVMERLINDTLSTDDEPSVLNLSKDEQEAILKVLMRMEKESTEARVAMEKAMNV